MRGHQGKKPRKKKQKHEGETAAKNCYLITLDLFRAYCSAYKYETKQTSKPAYLDQFNISMETKAVPL